MSKYGAIFLEFAETVDENYLSAIAQYCPKIMLLDLDQK